MSNPSLSPARIVSIALLAVLLAGTLLAGMGPSRSRPLRADEGAKDPASGEVAKVVRLIIDYGDGVEKHFTAVPWQKDLTVLGAMRWAAKHPRGIRFQYRGTGERVLLTQIDGQKNEGARGRNWIYQVNDKQGDRSIGIYTLGRGDTILWRFQRYR